LKGLPAGIHVLWLGVWGHGLLLEAWWAWAVVTAVVDDGQQQIELFECPLLGVKLTTWIENIHQTFHLGDLSGELQLVGRRLLFS
jgi:hypothetical protein